MFETAAKEPEEYNAVLLIRKNAPLGTPTITIPILKNGTVASWLAVAPAQEGWEPSSKATVKNGN